MVSRSLTIMLACAALAAPSWGLPAAKMPRQAGVLLVAAQDDPTGAHAAIGQAQERLAEADAIVDVLQENVDKLTGDLRQKAEAAVAALRTIRDTYRKEIGDAVARVGHMTVAQLAAAKAALGQEWITFEQALDRTVAEVKLNVGQKKALIEARIKAEQAYWRGRITDLRAKAAALTANERAAIDAKIAKVRARADAAQARLNKLGKAGQSAWSALKQGFVNSRHILDDAYGDTR